MRAAVDWTIDAFYSRDALHSAVFATATCLSVHPSVTGIVSKCYCV